MEKQNKYKGLLLKEGLEDESILNLITITKTEVWDVNNATDFQPKKWTAVYFEVEREKVNEIADQFSHSLKPKGWYLNFSDEENIFVIFPNKVYNYRKGDVVKRREAIEFGKAVGIPESQLDWSE